MTNNDKKYLVPVEMDREYAAKIGINPNEIKRIRLYGKMTDVHFVEVDDEKTYYELMRPIWRSNKECERERRCEIPNENGKLIKCTGNCSTCDRVPDGGHASYEEMEEQYGFGASTESGVHKCANENLYTPSPEDIIADTILLEELWKRVSELSDESQTIVKMFSEGASERKIAEAVGLSKTALNYKKNKILKNLKNILSDYRPNN